MQRLTQFITNKVQHDKIQESFDNNTRVYTMNARKLKVSSLLLVAPYFIIE